jgi:hypothetical protein
MEDNSRKATDVLLDLESKIEVLSGTIRAIDLNIKILSNKLTEVMKGLDRQQMTPPKIVVEAAPAVVALPNQAIFAQIANVDPERRVAITAESKLPQVEDPGFRRSSRPESYAGDTYLKREGVPPPHQTPLGPGNKLLPPPGRNTGDNVAQQAPAPKNAASPTKTTQQPPTNATHNVIPVEQRVVDRNGKSVFLADVEIVDVASGEQISKSRTNAAGKWMAALAVGAYKVSIRKLEALTKERLEAAQTVKIDGSQSPLKLPMIILK